MISSQLDRFTLESLHAKRVRTFELSNAFSLLGKKMPTVLAIDIGGSKTNIARYDILNGSLHTFGEQIEQDPGQYALLLKSQAQMAKEKDIPVSISFAGPIDGTRPVGGPNVPALLNELKNNYEGDFSRLFPTLVSVTNDAVAGLTAGALTAKEKYPAVKNVIYLINGSGIGGAVLKDTTMFAIEPGHVEAVPGLNRFGQNKSCGMFGASYVCVELIAGGKAGIEDAWSRRMSEKKTGGYIARKMQEGDAFAKSLYDNSALVMANVTAGVLKAFELSPENTVIVFHGGVFEVPGYTASVQKIFNQSLKVIPPILLTSEFARNACLDGAAILGWLS